MQWHPFPDVVNRVGCRLWLLRRAAALGTNYFGRLHVAHCCREQRAARGWRRCGHLRLGTAICGRLFSFLPRLAHFCLCRGVHVARSLVLVSSGPLEERGECVVICSEPDFSLPPALLWRALHFFTASATENPCRCVSRLGNSPWPWMVGWVRTNLWRHEQ